MLLRSTHCFVYQRVRVVSRAPSSQEALLHLESGNAMLACSSFYMTCLRFVSIPLRLLMKRFSPPGVRKNVILSLQSSPRISPFRSCCV
jgi:hypothetical protein